MNKYIYEGPVLEFGRIVASYWTAETMAISRTKAESNLKYRFKKENNRVPGAKIDLPGTLRMVS